MDDLKKWAESSLWDDEETCGKYTYPLIIDILKAKEDGKRLTDGNVLAEVYELGPYVCVKSSQSHIGPYKNAVDFIVPDGTSVVAARHGRVIEVQETSNSGGPTPEYRDTLNYVTLQHVDGEYSQYCHLAQNSVRDNGIRVGMHVLQGQKIGIVAKTGWTDIDHLHFIVFRSAVNKSPFSFKSLKVRFE